MLEEKILMNGTATKQLNILGLMLNYEVVMNGITVRQFLNASGLPTKWSKQSKRMNTRELAKVAKNQTVMVVFNR